MNLLLAIEILTASAVTALALTLISNKNKNENHKKGTRTLTKREIANHTRAVRNHRDNLDGTNNRSESLNSRGLATPAFIRGRYTKDGFRIRSIRMDNRKSR